MTPAENIEKDQRIAERSVANAGQPAFAGET